MQILIAAIGKHRRGPETTLTDDYLSRAAKIARNNGFSGPVLIDGEAPKALSGAQRLAREGALLMNAAPPGAALVLMDEHGDNLSSKQMAQLLEQYRDQGRSGICFAIGGADGHGDAIRKEAVKTFSFGAATWPHMLVRVMLAEQIYRAMTMLTGHPYHRV